MSCASFFSASGRVVCALTLTAKQEVAINIPERRNFLGIVMAAFFHAGRIRCNLEILEMHLFPDSTTRDSFSARSRH
jgi:hypothetical protein